MIRAFKWLLITLVVLVVLIAGAVLILPQVFDPNDYKDTIADAVEAQTGRALRIEGDLALTVFPWLGVDVGPVEIGQPTDFQSVTVPTGTPFLRSERTQIRVKLLPLLSRRIEMDTVTAQGLVVHLAKNKDGRTNWDDLVQPAAPEEQAGESGRGTQPPGIAALALGGLNITQAALSWHDETIGSQAEVSNVELTTGAVDLASPIEVSANFNFDAKYASLPHGALQGRIQTNAVVAFDPRDEALTLTGLAFAAALHNAQKEEMQFEIAGELTYTPETQSIGSPKLALSAQSPSYLDSSGKVTLSLTDTSANLAKLSFTNGAFALSGELAGAVLGAGQAAFSATGSARGDLSEGTVEVRGLSLAVPSFEQAGTNGKIELTADLNGVLEGQLLEVRGLTLAAELAGAAVSGGNAVFGLAGDVDLDLANRVASSPAIEVTASSFDIAGHAGSFRATGALNANPTDQRFSIRGLAVDGVLHRGTGFNGPLPFLGRGDLDVDLTQGQVLGQLLRLESSGFDIDAAKGNLIVELDRPRIDLNRAVMSASGIQANGTLHGKAAFDGNLTLALDAKGVKASATAATFDRFRLQLPSFDLDGNRGAVDATGRLEANLEKSRIVLNGLTTKGKLAGQALDGGRVQFSGGANAEFDASASSFELSRLKLALRDLDYQDLQGKVDLSGNVVGNTSRQAYSGKRVRAVGTLEGKTIPGRKIEFDILSDTAFDGAADSLRISKLSAKAAGVRAEGAINVSNLTRGPTYKGTLTIGPFNPRPLLTRFGVGPIETADREALRTLSGRAAVAGAPGQVALENLTLQLDDSSARGRIAVSGLQQGPARPQLRFDLTLDGMDADRYMPPPSKKGTGKKKGSEKKGTANAPPASALPIALLTQFDVDGRLQVGKLKINNVRVSNFKLTARGKDGNLEFNPVTANLYRGTVSARGNIDTTKKVPVISVNKQLRGVEAGSLLADLQGKAPVTGTADFDLDVTTRGITEEQLLGNANGTSAFALRDGTIEDVNIVRKICSQLTQFGVVSKNTATGNRTPFSDFTGTGQIRKGSVYNEDMAVTSPFLRVTGKGNLDLVRQQVEYAVTAYLVDSCEGQGRGVVDNLVNVPIPIRISGPVAALRFGFDFNRLVGSIAQRQIEKRGTRLLEKVLGGKSSSTSGKSKSNESASGQTQSGSGSTGSSSEEAIKGLLKGLFK